MSISSNSVGPPVSGEAEPEIRTWVRLIRKITGRVEAVVPRPSEPGKQTLNP